MFTERNWPAKIRKSSAALLSTWLSSELRWEYFWFRELDMQKRTIPRFYQLAPGVVALTGLSGRGVPTGSMLAAYSANGRKASRKKTFR